MQHGILQIKPELWPSGYGDVIAMIDVAPERLVDCYGLELFEGADNLGYYRAAAIVELPSGRMLGFARHHGDPEPGTEVHGDVQDDPHTAIQELLQALELPESAVTWLRDAAVAPEPVGRAD